MCDEGTLLLWDLNYIICVLAVYLHHSILQMLLLSQKECFQRSWSISKISIQQCTQNTIAHWVVQLQYLHPTVDLRFHLSGPRVCSLHTHIYYQASAWKHDRICIYRIARNVTFCRSLYSSTDVSVWICNNTDRHENIVESCLWNHTEAEISGYFQES